MIDKKTKPHLLENLNPHFDRMRAKKNGLKRYFNGKPCKKGHIAERMVVNGRCCACMKEYKLKPEIVKRELERLKKDRDTNKEKYQQIWSKSRKIPKQKLNYSMYQILRGVIKEKYISRNFKKYLGYTREDLIEHLEKQFTKGMSWENYGKWHIDHIVPIKHFNYNNYNDPDFKYCWALANLRPLWASDNYKKSFKREFLL